MQVIEVESDYSEDIKQNDSYKATLEFLCEIITNPQDDVPEKDLLKIVRVFVDELHNKRLIHLACHAVSNVALNNSYALFMLENGVLYDMLKIYLYHTRDPKIIWKASSAVWNLARPSGIDSMIPSSLPEVIFRSLDFHQYDEKVTYTSIGALSNLAIAHASFFGLLHEKRISLIYSIAKRFMNKVNIGMHVAALIANIGVNGAIGRVCVKVGFVDYLIKLLNSHYQNISLVKHAAAGLHNISDLDSFLTSFCESQGLEVILRLEKMNLEQEILMYFDGLRDMANINVYATCTLHIIAENGFTSQIIDTLSTTKVFIDIPNRIGETPLDLALANQQYGAVEMLIAANASFSSSIVSEYVETDAKMAEVITRGILTRKFVREQFRNVIAASNELNRDIAQIITGYIPGIDVLCMKF